MPSNAQLIKKSFRELLADYEPHKRQELFQYAREHNPDIPFSEGMLTGALKSLTDPGTGYKCISRAVYQKIDNQRGTDSSIDGLIAGYVAVLRDSLNNMNREVADPFVFLELDESNRRKMREIQRCMNVMQQTIESVGEE